MTDLISVAAVTADGAIRRECGLSCPDLPANKPQYRTPYDDVALKKRSRELS